jgi:hypothetical protein
MAEPTIHEARDLEVRSPAERDELVRHGIITNPEEMPADLVERARERLAARAAERDATTPTQ